MDTDDLTATVREARKDRDDWKAIADAQAQIIDRDVEAQRELEECVAIARESREAAIARTNIANIQLLNVQRNFEEMRNSRDSHRDRANIAEQYLTTAREALVEIGRLASAYHADTRQQILDLVHGIVGTIITTAPYGAGIGAATAAMVREDDGADGPRPGESREQWNKRVDKHFGIDPSLTDACTIRDTTTDQSKVRNHPDEITQAEREAFWEPEPARTQPGCECPHLYHGTVGGPEPSKPIFGDHHAIGCYWHRYASRFDCAQSAMPEPRSATVELRSGAGSNRLIESHSVDPGQTIGFPTRGAEWVWLRWSDNWSMRSGEEIARLSGMVDAARTALNAEAA